jgi:hypothetical protein
MNNIELYIKLPNDLNYTRLDLFKDETISLTQVIQDAKDPGKVFTDFSRTFSLPASKTNNKFFKHYEIFTQSQTYSFDGRKKADAKIELNSAPFQKGKIRLEGVDLKNGRPDTYRITFFGEQNLKDILGDLKLQDLDWLTNFDTTYTSANIITGLGSGGTGQVTVDSVAYPAPLVTALIGNSMRAFYSSSTTPAYWDNNKQEINKSGGNLNPNQGTAYSGYYWKDLTFSVRLYVLIKAIEKSDITKDINGNQQIYFSDDFFNTTNTGFYNLYMLCQRNAGKILEGSGDSYTPNQQSNKGYINATLASDHENNLTLTNSTIRPYGLTTGQLFQFTLTVNFGTISDTIYVDLIEVTNNRLETTFTYTTSQSGGTRSYQIGNGTYELKFRSSAAQTVTSFSINLIDTFDTNSTTSIATGDVDGPFNIPSGGFALRSNIPDIKIVDFLSGLFKMFNLTATAKNGKITIDTLDDFYDGGTLRNITEFVDSTTKTVNKALPYRAINFKYEDTENILAKQHKEQFQSDWGSASYDDDGALDSNNTTYEIIPPFQHMKFERLYDGSTAKNIQVGHLLDDKREPYLGKPVLFYPIHLSSSTTPAAEPFNLVTEISGYDAGSSPAEATQTAYWIPSNSPAFDNADAGYPETINFGLELDEWNASTAWTDTLFEKYYKSYIVNVFRYNERITKIKARLPLKFLTQFTLADELQIHDLTYRINSITTNLQTGEATLELLNGREATAATGSASASTTVSSSNSTSASTACGYSLNTTVYYTGTIGNSNSLYTDSGLTTAYTGSGNFHAFPGNYYATIDSNGYISNYQPCPTLAPTMSTASSSNVTYNSFTMNGSLDVANGTVSARGFYWGTNAVYTNNTKQAASGTSTGSYSYNITGASANTPYYVTAYGINQHGENVGTTVSFNTAASPNVPTVVNVAETGVGTTFFTANLNITADGGATINGAGFYMGTDASSATNNTHYDISPAPSTTGNKSYDFGGLTANTTYYYWGTATNTFSGTKGVASSYETVQTSVQTYTYNNTYYNANDAYYACISSNPQTYYSTSSTFQAGIVLYTDSGLTTLAPDGYYARSNYSYQVDNSDGTLGAATACATSTVYRVRITAAYPGTNYYDMTTVEAAGLSTTNVMYFTAYWGSGRVMYSNVGVTTTYTGSGTWKTDQGSTAFEYSRYPEGKIFFARRQNYINGAWTDLTSTITTSGYDDYVCQVSSAGVLQILYWNYDTGALAITGSASMSGIKISSSGSADAATACSTTPATIVYYDGTSISNGTVIYTDSVSAGTSGSSDKFNGGGNWYKFENNYRAQISSTGVVSNYASC